MSKFIGKKEIILETNLEDDFVQVHLKGDNDSDKEIAIYNKVILEGVKTDEPNADESHLRTVRCVNPINDIVLTLLKYNIRVSDFNYIYQSVLGTIENARNCHEAKLYSDDAVADVRTIHHYKSELIN